MGRPSNAMLAERAAAVESGILPKVTYTPIHPGDPADTLWNRHRFRANIPTAVQDVKGGLTAVEMIELAKGNPHFIVDGFEQAEGTPATPETPEQYKLYAVGWIRTANISREMSSRWRSEDDLRVQCGVGDDDLEYIQTIYKSRLSVLKESEALAQSAVND
jgi:hypothetical protein